MECDTIFFPGSVSDNIKKGKSGDKYRIEMPAVNSSPRAVTPKYPSEKHSNLTRSPPVTTSSSTFSFPSVTTSDCEASRNSTSSKLFSRLSSSSSTLPSSSKSSVESSYLQSEDNVLENVQSNGKTQTQHQILQLINPAEMKQIGQIGQDTKIKNENEREKHIEVKNEVENVVGNAGNRNRNHAAAAAVISPDIREACSTMGGAHESILLLEFGYDTIIIENPKLASNRTQNDNGKKFEIENEIENLNVNNSENEKEKEMENRNENEVQNGNEDIHRNEKTDQNFSENGLIQRILNFILWVRNISKDGNVHVNVDVEVEDDVDVEVGVCEKRKVEMKSANGTIGPVEKQLIGIARGLIRRPPLLLFDDVASSLSLDIKEVSKVENCLAAICDSRWGEETTIVVSEKMSAISHADIIIVMIEGRVFEQGTHDDLIEFNGWYAKRWESERRIERECMRL